MGLTAILLFGVFVFPILIGILFLKTSRKIATIFLSIPFIFIIGVVSWWFYETNYRFVGSTDLAGERIGEISIEDPITDEIFATYGDYEEVDHVNYAEKFVFQEINIGASVRDTIIYIKTKTPELTTAKGIKIGDSVDQVKKAYGKKFFQRSDMGFGKSINYIDRSEKLHLQFWLEDDQVIEISLQAI